MSRGLGRDQRRLLAALYAAPVQQQIRWDIEEGEDDSTGEFEIWALPRDGRFGRGEDRPDGNGFYLISHLRLAESRHPSLRDCPPRSIQMYKLDLMDWFALNEKPTTPAERDLLRSWRAAYRRAAASLTERKLIDTALAKVPLEALGQLTWGTDIEFPQREAVLARITCAGLRYIEQRRAVLVDGTRETDDLRKALRAAGFLDIAEPPQRAEPVGRRRRRVRDSPRKRPAPAAPEPRPAATAHAHLDQGEVIGLLTSEGFTGDRVRAELRSWHLEQRRESFERFGYYGIALAEWEFGEEEIEELRQRLHRRPG